MQSSLIGKIEKAKQYAQEPQRVTFHNFSVTFRGNNDSHTTGFKDDKWFCTCDFFNSWGLCAHTLALEKILGQMLPKEAQTDLEAVTRI
jgi:hypothetical protein